MPLCCVTFNSAGPGCACLNPLLRTGVGVPVPGLLTIRELFCSVLGFSPQFMEERVATVFLNSQPVDDLDSTLVRPGDTLALAGAMPGIAGITMRRNSPVKALRADITCIQPVQDAQLPSSRSAGPVTVKLFNFIALEAGPGLLARGVIVPAARLAETLAEASRHILRLVLDEAPVSPADLAQLDGEVLLAASVGD